MIDVSQEQSFTIGNILFSLVLECEAADSFDGHRSLIAVIRK